MGPTPPGTGVIGPETCDTAAYSTSPQILFFSPSNLKIEHFRTISFFIQPFISLCPRNGTDL